MKTLTAKAETIASFLMGAGVTLIIQPWSHFLFKSGFVAALAGLVLLNLSPFLSKAAASRPKTDGGFHG